MKKSFKNIEPPNPALHKDVEEDPGATQSEDIQREEALSSSRGGESESNLSSRLESARSSKASYRSAAKSVSDVVDVPEIPETTVESLKFPPLASPSNSKKSTARSNSHKTGRSNISDTHRSNSTESTRSNYSHTNKVIPMLPKKRSRTTPLVPGLASYLKTLNPTVQKALSQCALVQPDDPALWLSKFL